MKVRIRTSAALAIALLAPAAPASATTIAEGPTHLYTVQRAGRTVPISTHLDPLDLAGAPRGRLSAAAAAPTLASGWCGTERSTDYTASSLGSAPVVKVLYAYPTDRHDFATYADLIQSDVSSAVARVASAPGATKTIRLDLGTDCATNPLQYVDIQSLPLAHAASYYQGLADPFGGIVNEVAAELGPQPGVRNFLIYADDVVSPSYPYSGRGQRPMGDSSDPLGVENAGGYYAVVFGRGGSDFFGGTQPYPGASALHEVTHTLGAVQDSAPHSTLAGHCTDEWDVMCYADGGANNAMTYPCGSPFSQTNEAYDCGEDDYFNPSPAPGSYLATHWNVQDSIFMCPLDRCQTADELAVSLATTPAGPHYGTPFSVTANVSGNTAPITGYGWEVQHGGSIVGGDPATDQTVSVLYPVPAGMPDWTPPAALVTDGNGVSVAAGFSTFTLWGPLPHGVIQQGPLAYAGSTVTLTAYEVADFDGEATTYTWNFGDGSPSATTSSPQGAAPVTTSSTAVGHTYAAPGSYTVAVTAADPYGATGTTTGTVNIVSPPTGATTTTTTYVPPPAPPVVSRAACVVPRLAGMKRRVATRALSLRHCATGRVRRRRTHAKRLHGRVIAQSVAAGRILPAGARVGLTIGR